MLSEPPTDEDRDLGEAPADDPKDARPARPGGDGARASAGGAASAGAGAGPPCATLPCCEVGVRHPRVGVLLNAAATAWLADPDTRIRLHGCDLRTGAPMVHDPTVYRPGEWLARVVRARDGHCRFPGCTTDAARCQLDHVVRFPDGPTTVQHLACLCSRHHRFKHSSGWTVTMGADGTCSCTTPTGASTSPGRGQRPSLPPEDEPPSLA